MSPRLKIALMLAPALIVLGGLFLGGLAMGFLRSLGLQPGIGAATPGLGAYRDVLSDPDVLWSLALSLHIAGTSTLLSLVIATGAALLLRRAVGRAGAVARFLFQLNLTVPHLVGAIGILYLFSQSGAFARLGFQIGLIERPADFPALVFDPAAVGIILQYVWKEVPFIGVILLAQLQTLGADYEAAARSLGASRWQAFRHVLLPLIAPAALRAGAIVFAFAFGAYEIPALLGQHHPAALPVLAWRSYTDADLAARPQAMAMAMVIATVGAGLIWAYLRSARAAGATRAGREGRG